MTTSSTASVNIEAVPIINKMNRLVSLCPGLKINKPAQRHMRIASQLIETPRTSNPAIINNTITRINSIISVYGFNLLNEDTGVFAIHSRVSQINQGHNNEQEQSPMGCVGPEWRMIAFP